MFRKTLLFKFLFLLTLISPRSYAQYISVNGYVIDALSGETIKNVNVFEKNNKIGTISNSNGYFKLFLKPGEIDLSFTDDLFAPESAKLVLKSDTLLTIEMENLRLQKKINQEQGKSKPGKHTALLSPFKNFLGKDKIN